MGRMLCLLYGAVSYLLFFGSYLYFILFLGGIAVPKTVDTGVQTSPGLAVAINLGLIILFGLPHSAMARQGFKRWWTRIIPKSIERSTFVLQASLLLAVLVWQWRPLPATVWHVESPVGYYLLYALFWLGFALAFATTFLIDHLELFGLRQVYLNLKGSDLPSPRFVTPLFYQFVRHPMQVGVIINLWATPHMSLGHLLLAAGMTAYIMIGTYFEERDLVREFGAEYRAYQQQVPKFIPSPGRVASRRKTADSTASD